MLFGWDKLTNTLRRTQASTYFLGDANFYYYNNHQIVNKVRLDVFIQTGPKNLKILNAKNNTKQTENRIYFFPL